MCESSKQPQHVPPFPPLKWLGNFWTGRVVLSSWRGFQSRLGPYASKSPTTESDGTVRLSVETPEGVAERPPSHEQANAMRYLLEHEEVICNAVVAAIFEEYPAIRRRLLDAGLIDEYEMPDLERLEQLKSHIGLSAVHVLRVVKGDSAYVGFELGCTWDEEHGLGVMMHQGRIVELPDMGIGKVNGAELASEDWMAEADVQSSE
jgi:hypothetical protein